MLGIRSSTRGEHPVIPLDYHPLEFSQNRYLPNNKVLVKVQISIRYFQILFANYYPIKFSRVDIAPARSEMAGRVRAPDIGEDSEVCEG